MYKNIIAKTVLKAQYKFFSDPVTVHVMEQISHQEHHLVVIIKQAVLSHQFYRIIKNL